ncbi:MAG: nucleoid-associated protein [Solobacterium sp.]|nr:nucleoid-associated protein [Solobacterium sp.]
MIDFNNARIEKIAVHTVGSNEDEASKVLSLQEVSIGDTETEERLKEFFFSAFAFDQEFVFEDDTDVNLNEVYSCACEIFMDHEKLFARSVDLANHLYDVSGAGVRTGEFYTVLFRDIMVGNDRTDGIGLFKSESKDLYLEVTDDRLFSHSGTRLRKTEKGCLMLDLGRKYPHQVYVCDSSQSANSYWKKDFLSVVPAKDEYNDTVGVLTALRDFTKKNNDMNKTGRISFLNDSLQYFEENDTYDFNNYLQEVMPDENVGASLKKYIEEKDLGEAFEHPFAISDSAVNNQKKKVRKSIKLDDDIEIRISADADRVHDLIRQGYDPEKQMNYYMIYFSNEK